MGCQTVYSFYIFLTIKKIILATKSYMLEDNHIILHYTFAGRIYVVLYLQKSFVKIILAAHRSHPCKKSVGVYI